MAGRQYKIKDLSGQTFGRWTVLRHSHVRTGDTWIKHFWLCRCECGTERAIRSSDLVSGHSKSCRCEQGGKTWSTNSRHGMHKTPEYTAWQQMKERCHNPKHTSYEGYGARGITFCERWQDFNNFIADMGLRPSPKHSLDRIDNDKGYSPDNCRWATASEQQNNKKCTLLITHNNQTQSVTQWARQNGLRPDTLKCRLKKGVPFDIAISTPLRK